MRGLKQIGTAQMIMKEVASFTDAWIETCKQPKESCLKKVASFTDAWIETVTFPVVFTVVGVASFTDAWIETLMKKERIWQRKSHLLQMRGLKQDNVDKH